MRTHPRPSNVGRLRGLLLALALLLTPLLSLAATPALAASGDCTTTNGQTICTFEYTGAAQTWTVPDGVTAATFDVYGAQGGNGIFAEFGNQLGGRGGAAKATLAVTPGQTLQVNVGGVGGDVTLNDATPGAGGFGGGGNGGDGVAVEPRIALEGGAGGGGASDVRSGTFSLNERLIVAGGGGGAGGGSSGVNGSDAFVHDFFGVFGGAGGSQTAGGAGGAGDASGTSGSFGSGGVGAGGNGGGGGGGGGYYGGGGGGSINVGNGGAGGGGGSGFGPAGVAFQTGVRDGHGLVIITYPPDTTAPTASPTQTPAATNDWNTSDVTVSWNWADEAGGSGIDVDNCTMSSTSSGEGTLELTASCADLAGNVGSASKSVNVDKTAPTVSYTGNAGTYTIDQSVNITCQASDTLSGLASSTCATISGPAYSFALGTNTYSAKATDKAGNTGSGSTMFTVGVTFDSLCTLSASFSTDPKIDQGLCDKLAAAKAAAASGDTKTKNNNLNAYRQQVAAQSGKVLTKQQATSLTNLSQAL